MDRKIWKWDFVYVFFYCVAFRYIDNNQDKLISRLADAVTHQSVGGSPHLREECHKIVHWTEKVLILLSLFFLLHLKISRFYKIWERKLN